MVKKKVLVVDDEKDISFSLKDILERKGCQAFAALKSEEAWEIFQKERPQACIIDIHMPYSEFDGVELLRKIREIDKEVKVIMLTVLEERVRGEEVKKLGIDGFLEKPLDSQGFSTLIEKVISDS